MAFLRIPLFPGNVATPYYSLPILIAKGKNFIRKDAGLSAAIDFLSLNAELYKTLWNVLTKRLQDLVSANSEMGSALCVLEGGSWKTKKDLC